VLASYSLVSMYGLFLTADRWGLLVLHLRVRLGGVWRGGLQVTALPFDPVDVLAVGLGA
jgi:hypothetical protein